MTSTVLKLVQGDHGVNLYYSCKNVDPPYSAISLLTATSVKFRWKDLLGVSQEAAMTIIDAAEGLVGVALSSSILAAVMTMKFEIQITFDDGRILTSVSQTKAKVRAHA